MWRASSNERASWPETEPLEITGPLGRSRQTATGHVRWLSALALGLAGRMPIAAVRSAQDPDGEATSKAAWAFRKIDSRQGRCLIRVKNGRCGGSPLVSA